MYNNYINININNYCHKLHSTNTEKLQKYTDIKDELTRIWQLNAVYV